MHELLLSQRLWALFFVGTALFNFPLIALWDEPVSVLGVPLFPAALFVSWALLIGSVAWLMERQPR
jgi:hypothetical protein